MDRGLVLFRRDVIVDVESDERHGVLAFHVARLHARGEFRERGADDLVDRDGRAVLGDVGDQNIHIHVEDVLVAFFTGGT